MPEFQLYTTHALGGREPLRETLPGIDMEEVAGRCLVSVAARRGAGDRLREAVRAGFAVDLPGPGRMAAGPQTTFAWTGQGQWFADAAQTAAPDLEDALRRAVGDTASLTEQSDAWVRLRLSGPGVRPALERLCMLDLDDAAFAQGSVARTVMEHLGVVILRPGPYLWELWSARSSARSCVHALRTAATAAAVARG